LPGHAAPAEVESARRAAAAAFGHAAVADLPAGVLVVGSPRPVVTDPAALAERLPVAARLGWEPAEVLAKGVVWRAGGAGN
ncbi:MAG: hypothetical protein SF051_02075, partial [Elusimicrobiota bacterium]|nr:hypothetical protein [Elusimicrobiota bacterium]